MVVGTDKLYVLNEPWEEARHGPPCGSVDPMGIGGFPDLSGWWWVGVGGDGRLGGRWSGGVKATQFHSAFSAHVSEVTEARWQFGP